MNFDQIYRFKDVIGVFSVEGWIKPKSLDMDLKVIRDEDAMKRNPRKCLTLDDVIDLSAKLLNVLEKHKELNP